MRSHESIYKGLVIAQVLDDDGLAHDSRDGAMKPRGSLFWDQLNT